MVVVASLTPTACAGGLAVPGSFTGGAAASGPDLTLTAPTCLQVGDIMLAQVVRDQSNQNLVSAWTSPAGWTRAAQVGDPGGNGTYSSVWWKVATATDLPGSTTYTWSTSHGNLGSAAMLVYRGYSQVTPVDATSGAWGVGTSLTAPSVTTTAANEVLVAFFAVKDKTVTLSLPGRHDHEYDYLPSNSPDYNIGAADEQLGAAGATGSRLATASGKGWAAQLVALRH